MGHRELLDECRTHSTRIVAARVGGPHRRGGHEKRRLGVGHVVQNVGDQPTGKQQAETPRLMAISRPGLRCP